MVNSIPKKCDLPKCGEGSYYDDRWNCWDNPKNCIEAQNLRTKFCLKANKGYFVKDDGRVYSCKETDLNCLACEDKTGSCLECKEGKLEKGVCNTRPELDGAEKAAIDSAKAGMATASLAMMPMNTSGGIRVIKII